MKQKRTLSEIADYHNTDKGMSQHRFTEYYDLFFSPKRESATKILEIGILRGKSLCTMEDYFQNAEIFGMDIKSFSPSKVGRISMHVADQSDRSQMQKVIDICGSGYDVIVEDGGHMMAQQQISLGFLFKFVKPGGIYIIEDLHTSIAGNYQDHSKFTTLDMCHNFMKTGKIESDQMYPGEQDYLNEELENLSVMRVNTPLKSITAVLIKKSDA